MLLERFCRYVRINTQANEQATTYPSSPGQLELGRLLVNELRALGLSDVEQTAFGIVYATLPATVAHTAPTIAWFAHLDTSPETSGLGVQPVLHLNYSGLDLRLPGDPQQVLRVADNPALRQCIGHTLITTDGTTLLGADNKAGVAVIMTALAHLLAHPEIPHGPIRVCFTCDEEIGHGTDHVDLARLGAVAGYTLDGMGQGEIESETFSGDKATVTITGVNIHPSVAKGKMVNAIRLAGLFLERLPRVILAPEMAAGRDGFLHPYTITGGVASVTLTLILRDFITAKLADYADLLRTLGRQIETEYPAAKVDVQITPQYRNLGDGLVKEPRAVPLAQAAMTRAGLTPTVHACRGGTDGSLLTAKGLPTPNLSTGEHNPHSPLEWTTLQEMDAAVRVLVELAQLWGQEGAEAVRD
jgi:tripeptide aminopeptidase